MKSTKELLIEIDASLAAMKLKAERLEHEAAVLKKRIELVDIDSIAQDITAIESKLRSY